MNWLEELEKSKAQLEKDLEKTNEQIYQEKLKQHGLSLVNCIVIVSHVEFKVTRAEFSFKKPWLWGVSRNKNGEWGVKEHCLYSDWELK
jgi:hypothetical protein